MVATQPSTILFLAANPLRVPPLQLGEECRAIEDRIRAAKYRDRIRFRSRWAARPDDLLQALNEDAPAVLHFSGHGTGEQGLCFQSEDGSPLCVSAEGLGQVMQSAGTSVTVVVLNACFSEVQAQALVKHVPCVIGMSGAIKDDAAVIYAGAFYRALAFGKSVANAHKQGLAALSVHLPSRPPRDVEPAGDAPCEPLPRLLTRPNADADCIRIVKEPAKKARCELVIKATLSEFNAEAIARIAELLREITGDLSLEITDIKEGSVRLTISLSLEAAEKLVQLRADGQLGEICGFTVSALFGAPGKEAVARDSVQAKADSDAREEPKEVLDSTPGGKMVSLPPSAWNDSVKLRVSHRQAGLQGMLLGNYRVIEFLGRGGMGQVYVGQHETLGYKVAVKVLQPELSRSADMVQRFFKDAQVATAIRNPMAIRDAGIVHVFDFGMTTEGCAYLVMELLEGESVATRLMQRQLNYVECCRIGRQVANVVQAAHAAGIMHLNLKPANLFLIRDPEVVSGERVKVLDFGLAKLAGEAQSFAAATCTDLIMMSSPMYMSPEQCRSLRAADARSDVYALGCILFEMACGRPPFSGHGIGDIAGAHMYKPPPSPQLFAPNIPRTLSALISKMLEKAPDARPQTMAAVSQVLDEVLHAIGAGSSSRPSMSALGIAATVQHAPDPIAQSATLPGLTVAAAAQTPRAVPAWSVFAAGPAAAGGSATTVPPGPPVSAVAADYPPQPYPSAPSAYSASPTDVSPGGLSQMPPFGQPRLPASMTDALRYIADDESPSQYKIPSQSRRWLAYVVAGLIAVSVAAGSTFLIISMTRQTATASGLIRIESVPAGGDVFINNNLTGKTPLTIERPVGTRFEVRVEMPRHRAHTETVKVPRTGAEISVSALLLPITGKIVVNSQPAEAEIWLDGQLRGRTPMTLNNIDIGTAKKVEVRLKDYQPFVTELDWPADGQITLNPTLQH